MEILKGIYHCFMCQHTLTDTPLIHGDIKRYLSLFYVSGFEE
jgi:hypothetical protein